MADDPNSREATKKLASWFFGPKAENAETEEKLISFILQDYFHWRRNYYPSDEIVIPQSLRRELVDWNDGLAQKIAEMLAGLRKHFPFYSPRYMAHMMSDQTLPSVLGYFAGLLYNPNNVTPEVAPVTERWELEVGRDILEMIGYKAPPCPGAPHEARSEFGWAHVTSGGTVANIEALWAARNAAYFPLAVHRLASELRLPLRGDSARSDCGQLERVGASSLSGTGAQRNHAPASSAGGCDPAPSWNFPRSGHRENSRTARRQRIEHFAQRHSGVLPTAAAGYLCLRGKALQHLQSRGSARNRP